MLEVNQVIISFWLFRRGEGSFILLTEQNSGLPGPPQLAFSFKLKLIWVFSFFKKVGNTTVLMFISNKYPSTLDDLLFININAPVPKAGSEVVTATWGFIKFIIG